MQRWAPRVDHIDPGPRHVAVMFADVDGLAGLIESIGAEMAVSRVAPVMNQLVALVLAHAGLVQHIVGGAFMSVFGLNSKAGDEAAHAVRAGVALVSAAADRRLLPVHVGIECGEVVVSRSWEPAGFAVWGHTVMVAKELCGSAGPDTILLGPRAFSLAGYVVGDVTTAGASSAYATGDTRAERGTPARESHRQIGVERWPTTNALTRAEAAVARLVAEGLSNPQIANRLYISRHTAETHMKHIFAKLGVSSRAELAARVASRLVAGVA